MRAQCLLVLVLAACDEEDFCDPNKHVLDMQALDTTSGDFVDNYDYASDWDVQATAVDGVQHVTIGSYTDCGTRLPSSEVTVTSSAPVAITASAVGPDEVELHAYAAGTADIDLVNANGLHATRTVEAMRIDH